ncbi:hypothetical protein KTGMC3_P0840 [Methanocalculus sp. MC3]
METTLCFIFLSFAYHITTKKLIEKPNNKPVISLKQLLLFRNPINCVVPSITMGIKKGIRIQNGRRKPTITKNKPDTKPKYIPKHLLQRYFSKPKNGIERSFFR